MTTKYPPLITQADIDAIHRGNELNRQTLQAGLNNLVKDVHKGNQQSADLIKGVNQLKWLWLMVSSSKPNTKQTSIKAMMA